MTLEDKVHGFRLHLFRRAQELGNVSAACEHPFRVVKRLWGVRQDEVPRDREEPRPSPHDVCSGQPLRRSPPAAPARREVRPVIDRRRQSHLQTPSQGEAGLSNPDSFSANSPCKAACAEVP